MTIPPLDRLPVNVADLPQDVVDALPDTVFGALVRSMRNPDPDPVADFESGLPLRDGNSPEEPRP